MAESRAFSCRKLKAPGKKETGSSLLPVRKPREYAASMLLRRQSWHKKRNRQQSMRKHLPLRSARCGKKLLWKLRRAPASELLWLSSEQNCRHV